MSLVDSQSSIPEVLLCKRYRNLRGGHSNKTALHDSSRLITRFVWSFFVCFVGVNVVCLLMFGYFFVAARILEFITAFQDKGGKSLQDSPHIIGTFAVLGSIVGCAGGGACMGYLAPFSPCTHAALVGATFSLLQLRQVTTANTPRWFSILSVIPYVPTCIWAAAFARRESRHLPYSQLKPHSAWHSFLSPHSDDPTAAPACTQELVATEPSPPQPLHTEAPGPTPGPVAHNGARVTFLVSASWVGIGREVAVTGSAAALGHWNADAAQRLRPDPSAGGGAWRVDVEGLPPDQDVEYKYLAVPAVRSAVSLAQPPPAQALWEALPGNRLLRTPPATGGASAANSRSRPHAVASTAVGSQSGAVPLFVRDTCSFPHSLRGRLASDAA